MIEGELDGALCSFIGRDCLLERFIACWEGIQGKMVFPTSEEHDIGHMFHTWFRALGIDGKKTEYMNNGQPLPIAHDECHAVEEVLA